MEKDFGSWFLHQTLDRQSPNLTAFSSPFYLGQQSTIPGYMSIRDNTVDGDGALPMFAFSRQPYFKASQTNEPGGWFYCLPRFRQAFAPVPNSVPQEKLPADLNENCKGAGAPNVGSGCPQKRFLVFDQSGDQTTLIYSSGNGTRVPCPTSWNLKPSGTCAFNKEDPGIRNEPTNPYGAFLTDAYGEENHNDDLGTEMHEDTEELDALCSDDDYDYSEDDEETSTGHSPSTMTAHDKQELSDESGEEVASSAVPTKRRKLLDGGYSLPPSLMDTASSVKTKRCFQDEDDAESSCGRGNLGSLSGSKRSRKEKIREAISILETIIPGRNGKDAVVVLDEAISYLKSLKLKAKALGL